MSLSEQTRRGLRSVAEDGEDAKDRAIASALLNAAENATDD